MPDFVLTPQPFLGGCSRSFGDTSLTEVTDLAIVSLARPLDGDGALDAAIKGAWGCETPAPGRSSTGPNGLRVLRMSPDQLLVLLPAASGPALAAPGIADALGGAAYVTEQTDNWVVLRLDGPLARPALERICPIDLHEDAFAPGQFARTMMEHLGAVVLREETGDFLLLSASSSAGSFLHAVETSLEYVS